ncbi:AMP-binding protein [Nocardioides sp.]|uniref:AMP-binding protein n=1 Tax=Nocardioides sp. TaxID=35761 RepID=UPI0039E4E2B1
MYLTQQLHRRTQRAPAAPLSIFEGRITSNAETLDAVARIAGRLRGLGAERDDRVAILAPSSDRFFQTLLAVAWADAIVVPINLRWAVPEVIFALRDSGAKVLVVGGPWREHVDEFRAAIRDLVIVDIDDHMLAAADPIADAERRGDDTLGIFYTGGTTGRSKGVELTHRNVMTSALSTALVTRTEAGAAGLLVMPAFHIGGIASWVNDLLMDCVTVFLDGFDAAEVLRIIEEHRIRHMALVPTMVHAMLEHPDRAHRDVTSLESIVYGAAPISSMLLARIEEGFPNAKLYQTFGMTELSPVASILTDVDHQHDELRRSVGRALPHVLIRVVDDQGEEVPRGNIGEIVVSGDNVMKGYWNLPEVTAQTKRNGWLYTGDAGQMTEDGYLYIADRLKDMIISGGENVYSLEVEEVISGHPAVVACAVIGVPDERWGERVHAVVELVAGESLTLDELRAYAKERLAGFKCPRSMEVIDQWPVSAVGKILKRELRDRVSG